MNLSERKRYRRGLNRFAWTRAAALCLFLKLLLTTSIFLSPFHPLLSFLRTHLYAREWTRDVRVSPARKVFANSRHGPHGDR